MGVNNIGQAAAKPQRQEAKKAEAGMAKQDRLGQLRLLTVLDALLREGSVSGAAASLDLKSPAISRMLAQLRQVYGDALFIRTAKGLVPTPFAEGLRQRVRSVSSAMEHLFAPAGPGQGDTVVPASLASWEHDLLVKAVPLAVKRDTLLQGEPSPVDIANQLSNIDDNAEPQKRLAKYIATTGAGAGQSRPLTLTEATDAMAIILDGQADPIQLGALMVAIGYRGVTAVEVAGFASAARTHIGAEATNGEHADLDWPVYLSPKVRTPPWFLHAARLVAQAGFRVLLHGHFGQGKEAGKLELASSMAEIPVCENLPQARNALATGGIAYLPLGAASPQLQAILGLYPLLHIRLPVNTVVHLMNPMGARVSFLGVTQPSSRELHRDAAQILGTQDIMILGNTRDIAEFTPFRSTTIHRLVSGKSSDTHIPSRKSPEKSHRPATYGSREYWHAVWTGAARDASAEVIILSTAAAAFLALDRSGLLTFEEAYQQAARLWKTRLG